MAYVIEMTVAMMIGMGQSAPVALVVCGRMTVKTACLYGGAATCVAIIQAALAQDQFFVGLESAILAVMVWLWWNNGGDDDTRRKLRAFREKFEGTRRTAPTMG